MLDIHRLERSIEEEMKAHHVPGLAIAALAGGEPVYARGLGVTSVETGQAVRADTLFRIGSITKPLTATAIMRLVERGTLELDRPVTDYVPWLRLADEGAAGQMTLRLLLSHSAGLPTDHSPSGPRDPAALQAYVRDTVSTYALIAPPGKLYAYSNPGIRVAGYVAEHVSGRPYTELMQELVFEPLAMKHTTFDPTVAMTYSLALPHDVEGGKLRVRHRYPDDASGNPSGFAISTVLDLANLAQAHMAGGRFRGREVLAAASVAEMQTVQAETYGPAGSGYGLGWELDVYRGRRRVAHNGDISTFGARLAMVPEAGVAVALLASRVYGFWPAVQRITDTVLDQLLGLPSSPTPPPAIQPGRPDGPPYPAAGVFLGDWRGLVVLEVEGERLVLDWNGVRVPLDAHRENVYIGSRPGGDVVTVGLVPEDGRPCRYVMINGSPAERREPGPAFQPDPAGWAAYAGRYTGVEIFDIRLAGGRLFLYSEADDREMPLVPIGPDRFACDLGVIQFRAAAQGGVPELLFGRVYTLSRARAQD